MVLLKSFLQNVVLAYVTNNVNSPAFKLNSVFNYFKVFNYFNTSTIQIVRLQLCQNQIQKYMG